jgi:predicted dehydrogenase
MKLKIAVIGTGKVARNNYLPFLAQQEEVALSYFNRTRDYAESSAEKYGGRVAGSVEELMQGAPDVVMILTSEKVRYEMAMAALEFKPKHLFFEKPLVAQAGQANVTEDDFEKAREVLRKAKAAGTQTAMVFNYRFFDQTQRARKLVIERNLGKLIQVSAFVHYACWSHSIDLIHLFGGAVAEITALSGVIEHRPRGFEAKDVAAAFVTEGGATGTILGTSGTSFEFPLFELLFGFEGGRFTFRGLDGDMELLDYNTGHHELYSLLRGTSQWDQYNASFEKATGAYLESVRAGVEPPVPGLAGLQELQFEAALKRSIREGKPIHVQEAFGLE